MRKTLIGSAMALALAVAPVSALAQDDDDDMMGSMVPHPAHIHEGSCPDVGAVVAPLADVTVAGTEAEGAEDHIHVDVSVSTVELALADILAGDHAINVHQSAEDMGTYIACGNIGGNFVDDAFVMGLGPVDDSDYTGIAWLTDNGDGTTEVRVAITRFDDDMDDDGDDAMDDDMDDSDDDMDDSDDSDDDDDMDDSDD